MSHLELVKKVIYICGYPQSARSRSLSNDSLDKLTSDNNTHTRTYRARERERSSPYVCVYNAQGFFVLVVIGSQVLKS